MPRWSRITIPLVAAAALLAPTAAAAEPGLALDAHRATLGPRGTTVVLEGTYTCGPFASGRPDRGVIDLTVRQTTRGTVVNAYGYVEPTVCDGTPQPYETTLTAFGGRLRPGPATWIASGYVEGDGGMQNGGGGAASITLRRP